MPPRAVTDDFDDTSPFRPQYGLCPACEYNDGVVLLGGVLWAVCHRHRSRWEVAPDVLDCLFVPEGQPEGEGVFRPAPSYSPVRPVGMLPADDGVRLSLYADVLERDRTASTGRVGLTLVRPPSEVPESRLATRTARNVREWVSRLFGRDGIL